MPGYFDELKVAVRIIVDEGDLAESKGKLRAYEQDLRKASDVALAIGAASAGALTLIARANISFSETMSQVRAILAGRTGEDELAELEDRARRLARELPVGPRETAAAMLEMARAGATMKDVFAATGPVVELAIFGGVPPSDIAQLMVSSAAQFQRPLTETRQMANAVIGAVENTLLAVSDTATILRHAGPLAGVMGMDLEEALAFLAMMRQGGLRPEMASTSMRNQVSRLMNLTGNQTRAFEGMGIDPLWVQEQATVGNFIAVLDEMIAKNATAAQFEQVFQQRALVGALIYRQQGQQRLRDLEALIRQSVRDDRLGDVIEIQLDSLFGVWVKLKSIFDDLLIELGKAGINQFLTALFRLLRWGINVFMEMPGPVRTMVAVMILLGTSLLFVGAGMRMLLLLMSFSFFPALVKGVFLFWAYAAATGGVRAMLGRALAVLISWAAVLLGPVASGLTLVIAKTLSWTIALLANPVVLKFLLIAAVIGAVVFAVIRFGDAIQSFLSNLFGWVADIAEAIGKAMSWLFTGGPIRLITDLAGGIGERIFPGAAAPLVAQSPHYEFHNRIERMDINAEGGDPDNIARKVNQALGEQNKVMVAEFDTGVAG